MNHQRQFHQFSCAAVCYSMLTGASEAEAMKACKTTKTGTSMFNVLAALNQIAPAYLIQVGKNWFDVAESMARISEHYPLVLSGHFKTKYHKAGRPAERHHAFVLSGGLVYDPSENDAMPFDCFEKVFNRGLWIKEAILFEKEVDGYGKNR